MPLELRIDFTAGTSDIEAAFDRIEERGRDLRRTADQPPETTKPRTADPQPDDTSALKAVSDAAKTSQKDVTDLDRAVADAAKPKPAAPATVEDTSTTKTVENVRVAQEAVNDLNRDLADLAKTTGGAGLEQTATDAAVLGQQATEGSAGVQDMAAALEKLSAQSVTSTAAAPIEQTGDAASGASAEVEKLGAALKETAGIPSGTADELKRAKEEAEKAGGAVKRVSELTASDFEKRVRFNKPKPEKLTEDEAREQAEINDARRDAEREAKRLDKEAARDREAAEREEIARINRQGREEAEAHKRAGFEVSGARTAIEREKQAIARKSEVETARREGTFEPRDPGHITEEELIAREQEKVRRAEVLARAIREGKIGKTPAQIERETREAQKAELKRERDAARAARASASPIEEPPEGDGGAGGLSALAAREIGVGLSLIGAGRIGQVLRLAGRITAGAVGIFGGLIIGRQLKDTADRANAFTQDFLTTQRNAVRRGGLETAAAVRETVPEIGDTGVQNIESINKVAGALVNAGVKGKELGEATANAFRISRDSGEDVLQVVQRISAEFANLSRNRQGKETVTALQTQALGTRPLTAEQTPEEVSRAASNRLTEQLAGPSGLRIVLAQLGAGAKDVFTNFVDGAQSASDAVSDFFAQFGGNNAANVTQFLTFGPLGLLRQLGRQSEIPQATKDLFDSSAAFREAVSQTRQLEQSTRLYNSENRRRQETNFFLRDLNNSVRLQESLRGVTEQSRRFREQQQEQVEFAQVDLFVDPGRRVAEFGDAVRIQTENEINQKKRGLDELDARRKALDTAGDKIRAGTPDLIADKNRKDLEAEEKRLAEAQANLASAKAILEPLSQRAVRLGDVGTLESRDRKREREEANAAQLAAQQAVQRRQNELRTIQERINQLRDPAIAKAAFEQTDAGRSIQTDLDRQQVERENLELAKAKLEAEVATAQAKQQSTIDTQVSLFAQREIGTVLSETIGRTFELSRAQQESLSIQTQQREALLRLRASDPAVQQRERERLTVETVRTRFEAEVENIGLIEQEISGLRDQKVRITELNLPEDEKQKLRDEIEGAIAGSQIRLAEALSRAGTGKEEARQAERGFFFNQGRRRTAQDDIEERRAAREAERVIEFNRRREPRARAQSERLETQQTADRERSERIKREREERFAPPTQQLPTGVLSVAEQRARVGIGAEEFGGRLGGITSIEEQRKRVGLGRTENEARRLGDENARDVKNQLTPAVTTFTDSLGRLSKGLTKTVDDINDLLERVRNSGGNGGGPPGTPGGARP